jgi:hypothetical protein
MAFASCEHSLQDLKMFEDPFMDSKIPPIKQQINILLKKE